MIFLVTYRESSYSITIEDLSVHTVVFMHWVWFFLQAICDGSRLFAKDFSLNCSAPSYFQRFFIFCFVSLFF